MTPDLDIQDIEAVIFDLDGTLYRNRRLPYWVALANCGHLRLLKAEREARHGLMGRWMGDAGTYYSALFAAMAQLTGCSAKEAERWYNQTFMPSLQRMMRRHCTVAPWVKPTLIRLKANGLRTAVYSDYGCLTGRLAALGLDAEAFDITADAPTLGGLKPCRQSAEKLCTLLEVNPSRVLMVGDRDDTDGATARQCGMRFHLLAPMSRK